MMRPINSMRLLRAVKSDSRPTRCLSTTAAQRLPEADPRNITDMQTTEKQSTEVAERKPEGSVKAYHPEHQPDYSARVDHATGMYSPVPRRGQDGSESDIPLSAAVISGAPVDLQARTVR